MKSKIQIYGPDVHTASRLAARLNLALRHWDYAGPSAYGIEDTWADVGSVMDYYSEIEYELARKDKKR